MVQIEMDGQGNGILGYMLGLLVLLFPEAYLRHSTSAPSLRLHTMEPRRSPEDP
jgi:hypothetical protein